MAVTQRKPVNLKDWSRGRESELFEELLDRYEKVLLYAGQLQEQVRQQEGLQQRVDSTTEENRRLRAALSAAEAYIRIMEGALKALGI